MPSWEAGSKLWTKRWCAVERRPHYRYCHDSSVTATTLAQVATKTEQLLLADAPDAVDGWQARYSAVHESVYYFNPITGKRAASRFTH